jgi:hypothetical protein
MPLILLLIFLTLIIIDHGCSPLDHLPAQIATKVLFNRPDRSDTGIAHSFNHRLGRFRSPTLLENKISEGVYVAC